MRDYEAWVNEIEIDTFGQVSAEISCPITAVPKAGQYCLAWNPADLNSPLPIAIFLARQTEQGFLTAPGIPASWQPGNNIRLRSPLGKGFQIPQGIQRLALAALDNSPARLFPLISQALNQNIAVTLFTQVSLSDVSSAVEISHVDELPEAIQWADFMAIDLPVQQFKQLSHLLRIDHPRELSIPTQILLISAMPCGGMAGCGVCALPDQRHTKLVCQDGPVFDLRALEW